MNEFALKYGCNPNQKPSRILMKDEKDLPITVLSGRPGYINFLDAFNGWQLVKELKEAMIRCYALWCISLADAAGRQRKRIMTNISMSSRRLFLLILRQRERFMCL